MLDYQLGDSSLGKIKSPSLSHQLPIAVLRVGPHESPSTLAYLFVLQFLGLVMLGSQVAEVSWVCCC